MQTEIKDFSFRNSPEAIHTEGKQALWRSLTLASLVEAKWALDREFKMIKWETNDEEASITARLRKWTITIGLSVHYFSVVYLDLSGPYGTKRLRTWDLNPERVEPHSPKSVAVDILLTVDEIIDNLWCGHTPPPAPNPTPKAE